jgi:4-hydroxy-3-polyprenylbenzoate decarboxylase
MSENAITNWELEIGPFDRDAYPFDFYGTKDFDAPFASGSALYNTMIVCPCSMGVLGRIAHGVSNDLMTRAADVILKERRNLILVPRETPLSLIHINNMKTVTEAGGIICPASPSFYSDPQTKSELVDTVLHRVMDLAGLRMQTFRWQS